MADHRIGVIGICTIDGPIGPKGNHLRWTFPRALGFPPRGFRIYRKSSGAKPTQGIDFRELPLDEDLPGDLRIGGVQLIAHPAGRRLRCKELEPNGRRVLKITPSFRAQLELRFSQSIAYASVTIEGSGSSTLKAYQNKRLLAAVSIGTEAGEVSCAGITRLTVDLGSRQIRSISFTTETEVCNDSNWIRIKKLPLLFNVGNPLALFEDGLTNYYASSPDDAWIKYEQGASEIRLWMERLLSPTDEFFEEPDKPPNELKIRSSVEGPASSATYLQSVFLMAALDPNVARLMSLFWVDAFDPSPENEIEPPKKDQLYDYKVEGGWLDQDVPCGLVLNLGQTSAPQPSLNPDVEGKQLDGLRWINGQPFGRLGLKWQRPAIQISPQARAVQPILYEITRFSNGGKEEKIPDPVLVDDKSWSLSPPAAYVDRNLPLGEYDYEVRPIDLFGQLGSAIKSSSIKIVDLEAPPPPIRTRVEISQTEATANLRLQFEFGASQHQQAPDISSFQTYWKPDSQLSRLPVNVVVTSILDRFGTFHHTLRMRDDNHDAISVATLRTFVGDVLTNVLTGNQPPLQANQRRRYRIAEVKGDGRVVLEPTLLPMIGGLYELVRDPHNRHTWTSLEEQTTSWRKPISGLLQRADRSLTVEVLNVTPMPPRPDPLAFIPPEKRGSQFRALPPVQGFELVEVNRLLTEPDVFAGGTAAASSGASFELLYVVSNVAAGSTRIALPAGTPVAPGDTLTLLPPAELAEKVRLLRIIGSVDGERLLTPGGEIAFEHKVNGEDVTVIMRVISNAINRTAAFDLVVRADSAQDIGHLQPSLPTVRYYAPYVLSFPVALEEASDAPIELPLTALQGYRDGFLAVSATDTRNNEGPLGTPAQFSVIRPKPDAPSVPYPCGLTASAPAGYASPPNRAGRATTCLTWDTTAPADGIRYEVARALDNSILAAHLRDWQMGKITSPLELPVIAGQTVEGSLENITLDSDKGLIRATFEPDASVADPTIFRHGRLESNGAYFQVTLAKSAGTNIDLLLRGPSEPLPTSGDATLEAPPNYSEARNDVAALKRLALDVPDAFALVTGVPIDANRFIDDVAGKGRNAFFYRVRVVDAAENRSAWSPISAPFHQVDTTPPERPRVSSAIGGEREARVCWFIDPGNEIVDYRVYRSKEPELLNDANLAHVSPIRLFSNPTTSQLPLRPPPFSRKFGAVSLSTFPSLPTGTAIGGATLPRITAVYRLAQGYIPDPTMNFLVERPTRVEGRHVVDVNAALPESSAVVLIFETPGESLVTLDRIANNALTVVAGSIDFSFPYAVSDILGVFRASEFDIAASPLEDQTAQNYFTSTSDYDSAVQRVTGLASELNDGNPMVVVLNASVAGGPSATFFIPANPVTGQPLIVRNGELALDVDLTSLQLRAIHHADEFRRDLPLERQSAFNHFVTSQTHYQAETNKLKDLNLFLPDGADVVVMYEDTNGVRQLTPVTGEWCHIDNILEGLPLGSFYWYRVVAVKRVVSGSGPDDYIDVESPPSESCKVRVVDTRPPGPPAWATLEWLLEGETPVVQARWTSTEPQLTFTLQRRPAEGSWLTVSPPLVSSSPGEWQFVDRTADPATAYEYRVKTKNSLGIFNDRYNIQGLSAFA